MTELEKIFNLKNKIAVVTGGLGILGTEYAKALLRAGCKVAVLDIVEPAPNHELMKFKKKYPLVFIKADISKREEVERAFLRLKKTFGLASILINNAAIDFPPVKGAKEIFENYPLEKWQKALDVNLTGMLICSQVFGGAMALSGKGGSIINISSTYGVVSPDQRIYDGFVKPVAYSVTKSGVLNFTRYLATYWADKNVRVNTFTPAGVQGNQSPDFIKKYSQKVPLGRMAKKQEYNGVILFLASDASSYMTGSNLIVDGGWTAW